LNKLFLRFTTGNASKISWKMHELLARTAFLLVYFFRTFEAGPLLADQQEYELLLKMHLT
jgi:hypothetical protein